MLLFNFSPATFHRSGRARHSKRRLSVLNRSKENISTNCQSIERRIRIHRNCRASISLAQQTAAIVCIHQPFLHPGEREPSDYRSGSFVDGSRYWQCTSCPDPDKFALPIDYVWWVREQSSLSQPRENHRLYDFLCSIVPFTRRKSFVSVFRSRGLCFHSKSRSSLYINDGHVRREISEETLPLFPVYARTMCTIDKVFEFIEGFVLFIDRTLKQYLT